MIGDRYTRDEGGRPLFDGRPVDQRRREPCCECGLARYRVARAAHHAACQLRAGDRADFKKFQTTLTGAQLNRFTRHYYAQLAKEAMR